MSTHAVSGLLRPFWGLSSPRAARWRVCSGFYFVLIGPLEGEAYEKTGALVLLPSTPAIPFRFQLFQVKLQPATEVQEPDDL